MSVFVIADPGAAHCMELDIAKELTRAVAESGADAVKWQVYRADTLYVPSAYHDIVKQYEFPLAWLPILAAEAERCGIEFMASAFSKELYDAVDPFVKRHKIASLESGDNELIAHVVSK
jgi:sialic acid synthase SpsE